MALTTVVRRNELLWGEKAVTRALSRTMVSPVEWILTPIDVVLTDVAATTTFVGLLVMVAVRWGRGAFAVFCMAGVLTAPTRVVDVAPRPRPTEDLAWSEVVFGEGGYPSGHVVYAVLVFGSLALLVKRHALPSRARSIAIVGLWTLVSAMGAIRVAQLEHWPADAVAAYLFGGAFLVTVWATMPWIEAIAHHPSIDRWLALVARRVPRTTNRAAQHRR